MKNILRTIVLISAVIFAPLAVAGGHGSSHGRMLLTQEDDMTGWYIGGGLGFALSNWNNLVDGAPGGTFINQVGKYDDFAARVHVGYNFNRTFAEEFGYTLLPYSVKFSERNIQAGTYADTEAQNWAIDLSTRVSAPVPMFSDFTGYFRFGINYLKTVMKNHDNQPSPLFGGAWMVRNFNVTYGAGIEYAYNHKVRLRAEWQRFHGKGRVFTQHYQPYMDAFTLGLSLRLPENLIVL